MYNEDAAFLAATGTAAECARRVDWSQTALGPTETWPQSLRTVVGMMLRASHPMFLWWGPELIQFYNDAYLPSFGVGKHPAAMGQRGRDCWQEIWPIIGPQIEDVMRGQSTWHEDQLVPIFRNERLEHVYWTYGYSPVLDESNRVAGVLVVCTETTARVVAERRLRAAQVLVERMSITADLGPLLHAASDVFGGQSEDVPFSLTFLIDGGTLRLAGSSGLTERELAIAEPIVRSHLQAMPSRIDGEAEGERAGAGASAASHRMLPLPQLRRADAAPEAFVTSLSAPGVPEPIGFIVFGVTSNLPFDGNYRAHLEELAATLSFAGAREVLRTTREALQARLVIADRMASIGTLAAGAAHEINNPLAYVTANIDMVLEEIGAMGGGSPSARFRDLETMLREARQGTERVRKIIRGLKTFSRLDEESRAVTDVRPIVELSINMAANEIRHRARLVTDYRQAPPVDIDGSRLGQVLVNLLVNAAQAIPEGAAEVNEIRVATSTDAEGRAVIEVRDTGAGIPAHIMKQIFDPFFTTKDVGEGTGLGLAISRNIVEGLGGEITVESKEGHGACFRVLLPPASRKQPSEATVVERVTPATVRRTSVLVVDDEPAVGSTLARVLRAHDVVVVTNAREALELITSGREFDVILSDLMMPTMSGMDLYEALLQRAPASVERMVFMTGGAFTPAARAFLARVPNPRLEKPFDVSHVRAVVEKFAK